MTFSDKLIALRKKAGWSQEELAERLNVSRQSVSKWESAQSMPDIDKILQLSSLFSVTTDCLLKDMQDDTQPAAAQTPSPLPRVTLAQAEDYLTKAQANAPHCINSTTATATSTSSAIIPKPPARLSSKPSNPSSLTVPSASSGMGLTMQSAVASAICGALACALVR